MAVMMNTIYTWDMIERYGIEDARTVDGSVVVPGEGYEKMLKGNCQLAQSLCLARFTA